MGARGLENHLYVNASSKFVSEKFEELLLAGGKTNAEIAYEMFCNMHNDEVYTLIQEALNKHNTKLAIYTELKLHKNWGIVFSGGGAKGSYEIGVWRALEDMNLTKLFVAASGTSVGALNATLFAQGDYENAEDIWKNIDKSVLLHHKEISKKMENKQMKTEFTNEELQSVVSGAQGEAKKLLNNPEKMEKFLQRLEKKLNKIPFIGDKLADVPIMISLVRAYIKKEYTDIPMGTILGVVGGLIYLLSPIDLLPDTIPVVGLLDDVAVINFVLKMFHDDMDDYRKWRQATGKVILDM